MAERGAPHVALQDALGGLFGPRPYLLSCRIQWMPLGKHFWRLHSFWFVGIHDFFVDDVAQRFSSARHIQIMKRDPVAVGVPPMLATLFEGVASVVLDAWTSRVVHLEIIVALIAYVNHFLGSVARDDERHEQIREELFVTKTMRCVSRMCTITEQLGCWQVSGRCSRSRNLE